MEDEWRKQIKESIRTPEELAERFDIPLEKIRSIAEEFPICITPYYLSLIKEKNDPIYKQVIPDEEEINKRKFLFADPLAEDRDSPVNNIVHRYPDRCLFLVSHSCASYCRFCTRKRKVSDSSKISKKFINEGIGYIREHTEIRDVILSGGDPLMLSEKLLEHIISSIRAIPHVEIIRIGSRVPCFLPQRITSKLVNMLKKYHPLFMNVHFNHPDELTPVAVKALGRLADAGIPLGNQSVLLKGVNDNPETMKKLMQALIKARVRPYYLYQADMVFGTEHFRTTVDTGIEMIRSLRGWTSGLAVPHFVIDAPGGGGKIPLIPNYVQGMNDQEVRLCNYRGQMFSYQQPEKEEGEEGEHRIMQFKAIGL